MLDLETLRVVQASVAVCTFVLVFLGTFRTTRAAFAGWWSASLATSGLSSLSYVFGEDTFNVASAAAGNALAVIGAFFTWCAARSLVDRRHPWWAPAAVGLVVAAATVVENPVGDAWPGGSVLLMGMAVFIGLAAVELWALCRQTKRDRPGSADGESTIAMVSLALASTAMSIFYVGRVVVFATVGPDSWFYHTWAGPVMTTFVMTLTLVVVTYSVTTLSHHEVARDWKIRAMNDDLTGLFTRTEFENRARAVVGSVNAGNTAAVIVADIDHFKEINDRHGHAEGDMVLVAYADALRTPLGVDDLAARFGGEEFVLLVADADRARVIEVSGLIDAAFVAARPDGEKRPTVSYGAALWDRGETLEQVISRADAALYRAKAAGRDRVIIDELATP